MAKLVAVRLTKKPIRGTPVGGEMLLTGALARALVAVGLAEYIVKIEPPPAPQPKPKRKYTRRASRPKE